MAYPPPGAPPSTRSSFRPLPALDRPRPPSSPRPGPRPRRRGVVPHLFAHLAARRAPGRPALRLRLGRGALSVSVRRPSSGRRGWRPEWLRGALARVRAPVAHRLPAASRPSPRVLNRPSAGSEGTSTRGSRQGTSTSSSLGHSPLYDRAERHARSCPARACSNRERGRLREPVIRAGRPVLVPPRGARRLPLPPRALNARGDRRRAPWTSSAPPPPWSTDARRRRGESPPGRASGLARAAGPLSAVRPSLLRRAVALHPLAHRRLRPSARTFYAGF